MSYSPELVNSAFVTKLDNPEFYKEASVMVGSYIRDKLRDVAFARKILGQRSVSPSECQVSVNHDGLVYVHEVEPESGAESITWTGDPKVKYINAKKYEIPFMQIAASYEKNENELMATRLPLTKIIENNTIKDIGTVEDRRALLIFENCVARTGKIVKGTATNAGVASGDIEVADIIAAKNLIVDDERPCTTMLINDVDFNKLLKWTTLDIGYNSKDKMVFGNYQADNYFGLSVIRTAKTSLLRQGNIWFFSSPEFLGLFLVLTTTKTFVKKERTLISWSTWELIGMSVANIYSISKLELYSGASQTVVAEDVPFRSLIANPPKTGGGVQPTITSY